MSFDAVVATVVRLRSSEVHVGESVDAVGRRSGPAAGRGVGARGQARAARTSGSSCTTAAAAPTATHLGAHRAFAHGRRSRAHSSPVARRGQVRRAARPSSRHRRAALTSNGTTTERPQRDDALAAVRQVARPADELAAVVRARDFARAARHGAQPAAPATSPTCSPTLGARRSGRGLPRAAAQGRRRRSSSTSSQRAQEALLKAMAQEDVAGAAQRHGAGRPHHVPRRTARGRHAPAAGAADAGRARRSRVTLLGYPGRIDRPADDAALHRRPRGLDRPAGARLRPRRTGRTARR